MQGWETGASLRSMQPINRGSCRGCMQEEGCSTVVLQNAAVTTLLDEKGPTPGSTLCSLPSL